MLTNVFPEDFNKSDLEILFSKEDSILKFRIFDQDTEEGSIGLSKYINSLDAFKKILSQAVIFSVSKKPIFGVAKFEVQNYLERCRSLQTERGSYITKFEIPNDTIYTAIG